MSRERSGDLKYRALWVLGAFVLFASRAGQTQALAPNLLYTPIEPCRLFDTRQSGAGGPMVAGQQRTFMATGTSAAGSLAGQGGNPQGCPIPGFFIDGSPSVGALAINLIAVAAAGPGDLRAWPADQPTKPLASVLNYSLGATISNAVNVAVSQLSSMPGMNIVADVSGTHVVGDVVGYYANAGGGSVFNVLLGANAGAQLTSGGENVAIGASSFENDPGGNGNTAVGYQALSTGLGGNENTAIGVQAMLHASGSSNTVLGAGAFPSGTGSSNVVIGLNAGTYTGAEDSNILIGNPGVAGDSHMTRIGSGQSQVFISGIHAQDLGGSGTQVFINSNNQLGGVNSSRRFKEDIEDMGAESDALMKLRPVTFHYKPAYDQSSRLLQYGLIAEEVAEIYPGLVEYDSEGKPLAVRYHFVNAMLLNEVQKQHARIKAQDGEIEVLRAALADQEARLRTLESLIAKP